jgi:murein DD-endopeptidase MepM/ murein hydrolase activator NlpD
MKNKITFCFFKCSDYDVKQVTIPGSVLLLLFIGFITGMIYFSFVAFDYHHLKINSTNIQELKQDIGHQKNVILKQRNQIQKFAREMDTLKSKLIALNQFEEKIRIIADIDLPHRQNSPFGVGGSIPEDLAPQTPLTKEPDGLLREMESNLRLFDQVTKNQSKEFELLLNAIENKMTILASTPSIRPTQGWISSGFGYRESPFTGRREFHPGLDIATHAGTPIVTTADGIVTYVGRKGLLGKIVVVDHGNGIVTRYGHAKEILRQRGDLVKRGQTIALVGSTGRSTGPHLHYEVLLNGIPMNPIKYILN